MGMLFSAIFTVGKLPVLTLLISVLNFSIFTLLVRRFYLKSTFDSVLVGLLFFLNPLHIYLSLGFMTDNYFLFFLLLTFYFAENFIRNGNTKNFILYNVALFLGFWVKQVNIISGLCFVVMLLLKKKYIWALKEAGVVGLILGYYFFIFDQTKQMTGNQAFKFSNLLSFVPTYVLVYSALMYAAIYAIPIIVVLIQDAINGSKSFSWKKALIFMILAVGLYFGLAYVFSANKLAPPQFPYFKNTVSKSGFYVGPSLGSKYKLVDDVQLYSAWDFVGKIVLSIYVAYALFKRKGFVNYYTLFAAAYLGFMDIMLIVYDRYFSVLTPVVLLILVSMLASKNFTKLARGVIVVFLCLVFFYDYNLSLDFVLLNRYLWHDANLLVTQYHIKGHDVAAGHAWNSSHPKLGGDEKFVFQFKTVSLNKDISCCYKLRSSHTLSFPLSIWVDPEVNLYERTIKHKDYLKTLDTTD
jgi:hypothetical protein